jgi:hypothetical protein
MFFATSHWAGSRGMLLGLSGLMIGLAASSALTMPFLRAVSTNRQGIARYMYISISVALAIAVVLLVAAFLVPPG